MIIIGINGAKGAGKDTVGTHLVSNHGFQRFAFADLLKQSAAALWPNVQPQHWDLWKNDPRVEVVITSFGVPIARVSVREFLQRYGTEAHRDVFRDDFWIHSLAESIGDNSGDVVITDMRFPNEIEAVRLWGGKLWKVVRPGTGQGDNHRSEHVVPDQEFDAVFVNSMGIEELHRAVDHELERMRERV